MAARKSAGKADRWRGEKKALKKLQVHFEFKQSLMRDVRTQAAEENLNSSDYVRKVVGLPYAKIQRPRISLSFSEGDLALLAAKYGTATEDTGEIKRRVIEDIAAHFQNSPNTPNTPNSENPPNAQPETTAHGQAHRADGAGTTQPKRS